MLSAYDIVFETIELNYPNEKGIRYMCEYIGVDEAVGWLFHQDYLEDEEALADDIGEEKARIIADHYFKHCI